MGEDRAKVVIYEHDFSSKQFYLNHQLLNL